jgi:hypothetical protein
MLSIGLQIANQNILTMLPFPREYEGHVHVLGEHNVEIPLTYDCSFLLK